MASAVQTRVVVMIREHTASSVLVKKVLSMLVVVSILIVLVRDICFQMSRFSVYDEMMGALSARMGTVSSDK